MYYRDSVLSIVKLQVKQINMIKRIYNEKGELIRVIKDGKVIIK